MVIICDCDGTNYTVSRIDRVAQRVVRDNGNVEIGRDLARITDAYPLSAFGAQVQTGLTNFINAIDNKAPTTSVEG